MLRDELVEEFPRRPAIRRVVHLPSMNGALVDADVLGELGLRFFQE